MLIRIKWHLIFVLLFVSAGLFFFHRQKRLPPWARLVDEDTLASNDHDSMAQNPVPMNVTDAFCRQCSLCDVQQQQHSELKVVQDWDSSRVLRGPPSKHFRGMSYSSETIDISKTILDNLRNDTGYLTTCAVAGFSMGHSIFNYIWFLTPENFLLANQFMTYVCYLCMTNHNLGLNLTNSRSTRSISRVSQAEFL